jgi:hypothetical protein
MLAWKTWSIGRAISHAILAGVYLKYFNECWDRATKFAQSVVKDLKPTAAVNFLKNAKPGTECAQVCSEAGVHALWATVWVTCNVVVKYGITLNSTK